MIEELGVPYRTRLDDKPAVGRWMNDLAAHPGIQRGTAITPPAKAISTMDRTKR